MKPQGKHPIPTGAWARLVKKLPLDELWTIAGTTGHVRQRFLSSDEVDALLKGFPDRHLVEAQIDADLRWYPRGDYGFWRHKARNHSAEPDNRLSLDEFPDSMCYFVSEWIDGATHDRVLLFEQHH